MCYVEMEVDQFADITWNDLVELEELTNTEKFMLKACQPSSYYEIYCVLSISQNTYANIADEESEKGCEQLLDMYRSEVFSEYAIYTREDLGEILKSLGIEAEVAVGFVEQVRRGKAYLFTKRKDYRQYLDILNALPKLLRDHLLQVWYLSSRDRVMQRIVLLMRFACYNKKGI